MPRSYQKDEPAVRRADSLNWDILLQVRNRFRSYLNTGNIGLFIKAIIKGDFVLEGGTYFNYPKEYRIMALTQLYYACNTIYDDWANGNVREMLSLQEEIEINKTCIGIRITGLSIETRPDTINFANMKEMRMCGITKVQLGIQTCFDNILKLVNRGCYYYHAQKASKLLVNAGFKIQIHLMPDLPHSSPDLDKQMFEIVFSDPELSFDHLKVYPCMILDYTEIKEWYDAGTYHPYAEGKDGNNVLLDVLIKMTEYLKESERYDVRIERVVRDFTAESVKGGCSNFSLGGDLTNICESLGKPCVCIRCREISKYPKLINETPTLFITKRIVCDGDEYFISYETENRRAIFGFLRLRIPNKGSKIYFDDLKNAGIIREVHVYNIATPVGGVGITQHRGLGTQLVREAEKITLSYGLTKMAVISGEGVKEFYKNKCGFVEGEYYLVKDLLITKGLDLSKVYISRIYFFLFSFLFTFFF